jgi:hypothetical protein
MSTQLYSVNPHPIETILSWVKSGAIAIPEIQRPFVWDATQVRNLLDSLYQGYPVGYIIAWRNHDVKLKDGTTSSGKKILIDGQQRVTALMASLLGREVLTKDYENVRIRIGFNPLEERFEVFNPALQKDPAWVADISVLFGPDADLVESIDTYCTANPSADRKQVGKVLQKLLKLVNNQVGVIELAEDLDIETVTEIFIRVNSAGAQLSQADFAMSKIAANETYGGNTLRKAIDYFCHMAVAPEFHRIISHNDKSFTKSEFFPKMAWLKNENDDIYDPSYTDMLRVAFTSEFKRGKLQDLVALLSGRNFETRQYEDVIAEASFTRLKTGVLNFINETHFKRFVMILRSAGFVHSDLMGSQNAINFAYIIYLRGRADKVPADEIEQLVRRWYVMSLLTGRYAGTPETRFDLDIRQIDARGLAHYVNAVVNAELSNSYWDALLPQNLETSSSTSPYFAVYQAAQVKMKDKGFLSRDITVQDLIENRSDVHHVYPKNHLKQQGLNRGRYNQIANFVLAQTEINIAIDDKAPHLYFKHLVDQCDGGKKKYGGITDPAELKRNLRMHCLPEDLLVGEVDYEEFLEARRHLIAAKLKNYFSKL